MSKLKGIISRACIYAVSLCLFLFLFALMIKYANATIDIGGFLVILALSLVLSASQEVFTIASISLPIKALSHFAATLVAFIVIYVTRTETTPTKTFVAVILFSIIYAVAFLLTILIKRSINRALGKK